MENSEAKAVRFVRCPRCYSLLVEPNYPRGPVYRCGGCGTYLRAKIRTGSTGEVASDSSLSRRGHDQSANREVSGDSEAGDAQCSATSTSISSEWPEGSEVSGEWPEGSEDWFNDHKETETAPESAHAAASQSAQDVLRVFGREAAAEGEALELQGSLWYQNFKVADWLRPRAHEPSVPRTPPAAKEAKKRLPPRNHCRPVLKGAPFVICSSCYKLVEVPADFAVSTNTVHKLRCGSCFAVLSYSYGDHARKKPSQDSIDQLCTDTSELTLLEVLEKPSAPRRGNFRFRSSTSGISD